MIQQPATPPLAHSSASPLQRVSSGYPSLTRALFMAFALYLVLPLWDVPLLGLSLSAPIFYVIAVEALLRPRFQWRAYRRWVVLVYLFGVGLLFSHFGNILLSTPDYVFASGNMIILIRYSYWLLVFFCTTVLISTTNWGPLVATIIGSGIVVLAGLRLGEAVLYGRWGAWSGPQLLTQNSYGIQFSEFAVYGLFLAMLTAGKKRLIGILGLVVLILAIAGNGSRGSLIGTSVSTVVFVLLLALSNPGSARPLWTLLAIVSVIAAFVNFAPSSWLQPVSERYATFQKLEDDKSYAARQLMNQKAEYIFRQKPIFGVGLGNFKETSVPLTEIDLPDVYGGYYRQSHFDTKSSHNSYLQLLAEVGLVGFVPFALLLATLTVKGFWATLAYAKRGEFWAMPVYASFIGMSVHLWALAGLSGTVVWFAYGLVAGVIVRRSKHECIAS